jgi:hypothetical protein
MPRRQLPRSNDARTKALNACLAKANATTDPAQRLISPDQIMRLSNSAGQWGTVTGSLADLLRAQTLATKLDGERFDKLAQLISHYIQVMNLAIDRGEIPAEDRALYQLDVNDGNVPSLTAADDVKLWAGRVITGEGKRVAAGGPPMAMPTAAQVALALEHFNEAELAQSNAKTAYDLGQEAVNALEPGVDDLIKELWDTIEFALRNDDPSSLRRKAREWGVVYDGDAADTATPTPAPAATTAPAAATPTTPAK